MPTARIAASVTSDGRHPWTCTSQPARGIKIVLANPAMRVMAVRARTRSRWNHLVAVANAGSYSVADIVSPIAAQSR